MSELPQNFQCPHCGNMDTYHKREVNFHLTVDDNLLIVPLTVEECSVCHEQLLDDAASAHLTCLAEQLRLGNKQGMTPVGTAYQVK